MKPLVIGGGWKREGGYRAAQLCLSEVTCREEDWEDCPRALVGAEHCSPSEVSHLHHDHAHLLGQHDDVVTTVIPFGHFSI